MQDKIILTVTDKEDITLLEYTDDLIRYEFKDIDGFYYLFEMQNGEWTLSNTSLDEVLRIGEIKEFNETYPIVKPHNMMEIMTQEEVYIVDADGFLTY